jgi:hypothetical protein
VQLDVVVEAAFGDLLIPDHEFPTIEINTKSASIHTPFGLDGIFSFH